MRFLAALVIFGILLLSSCSAPARQVPIGVGNPAVEAPPQNITKIAEDTEPTADVDDEQTDKQSFSLTDNSSLSERVREARYSTVIDLTQLTEYNCEQKLDELEEMLAEALHDEEGIKDDIVDEQRRVARARQVYEDAKKSSDERDLIRTADDLEQEEDELQDLKNERYNIYRRVTDIKETLDRAEPRCMAMVKNFYK